MAQKVLKDSNGKVIVANNKAFTVDIPEVVYPKYTGTVDSVGLAALGWDAEDIQWLQDHVWWNAEDNAYWAVTEANLAFGPNGATPLTWADRANQKFNPDIRYYPKFNLSPVSNTSWNALFSGYSYVYAIPTHGWDTQYVTTFGSLFLNCYLLCSVGDLSGWNTAKVTSMGAMFQNCYSLLDIGDIHSWNTGNVTSLLNMFNGCYLLRSLNMTGWDTAKVTTMGSIFSNCMNLTSVGDLSGWDTALVSSMVNLFNNCYALVTVGDLSN